MLEITDNERKNLLKAQQAELNAVIMYKKLAQLVKDPEHKKTFLSIAADEGRHAAIIKKYTSEVLQPKSTLAFVVGMMYRVFGLNKTLNILSNGEYKAAQGYVVLAKKFTELNQILTDEEKHGDLMKNMKTKRKNL